MLSRCVIRNLNRISNAALCKQVLRVCLSSAATAQSSKPAKSSRCTFEMGRWVKPLDAEIKFNQQMLENGDEMSIDAVKSQYAEMLKEQGWAVVCPENSTMVELHTERGDMKIVVKFDSEMVADSVNSASPYEEEDSTEMEAEGEEEDYEEDMEYEQQPFTLTAEIHRPSVFPEKFMELELEATNTADKPTMYLNNISMQRKEPVDCAYSGPQFENLDEELREVFDKWTEKNLSHLVPFVADFSVAKEAVDYDGWLHDLKKMAQ